MTQTATIAPQQLKDLRQNLRDFNFAEVMNLLGWNRPSSRTARTITVDGETYSLRQIANLGGAQVLEVTGGADPSTLPVEATRRKLSDEARNIAGEHVLVFVNADRTQSHWFWVKRELKEGEKKARPQPRTHTFVKGQPDDLFISKLAGLFVDIGELNEDGDLTVTAVAQRLSRALDSEAVVKRFYTEFKDRRESFADAIQGIADERDKAWYASVMLNRLMFVYFLQRKGFLGSDSAGTGNREYLQTHLKHSRQRGPGQFYPEFLKALFFEAFAKPEADRDAAARQLTGQIPYLNGGLFLPHPIEERWPAIFIPDEAFDGILGLFGRYDWNLSDLDKHAGGLDPDVLGHIFEKYINQKGFGAYYTRPEITEYLCEQTVRRLVLERINARKPAGARPDTNLSDALTRADADLTRALLLTELPSLSLLDPACGSGAFLVAALKTLLDVYTTLVGRIHSFNDPTLNDWLKERQGTHPNANYNLKKKIITENLYGVDLMPEAAEIAKLRLFLSLVSSAQTLDDLEPLPNIDFNLLTGNSLVGLLDVNEAAYNSTKGGGRGQAVLLGVGEVSYSSIVEKRRRDLEKYRNAAALGIKNLTKLRDEIQAAKEQAYVTLDTLLHKNFHDLGIKYEQATWDDAKGKEGKPVKRKLELADITALKPFHWAFEFAEVMGRGGFDAIIANPPWDVWQTNEKEFFQQYESSIQKKKIRIEDWKKQQAELMKDLTLQEAWLEYASIYPHTSAYFKNSPQFSHNISYVNGKNVGSKINLYTYFLEQCFRLLKDGGRCGIIVPTGLYNDLGSKGLREMLFNKTKIGSIYALSNERFLFEGVDHRFKFAILDFLKGGVTESFNAAFRFDPRVAVSKEQLRDFFQNENQHTTIDIELVRRLSPDSLGIMEFKTELDAHIAEKLLLHPMLGEKINGIWNCKLSTGFNMTTDSHLFQNQSQNDRLPLYEGKMIHQYNHAWGRPKYWINESQGRQALIGKRGNDNGQRLPYQYYRLSIRALARNTDSRTAIATIIAPQNFQNYKIINTNIDNVESEIYLTSIFNSFVFDWILRQKVNTDVTLSILNQMPVPRLDSASPDFLPIVQAVAKLICTTPEFDELAVSAGLHGSIDGVSDEASRAALRAELDGRVAHLYGLSESEFTLILGTFPLVAQPVKDAALAAYRALKPPEGDPELVRLATLGESGTLEYKSSLRSPTKGEATPELRAALEAVIVKEVASFLNAQGGTLLIGLDDDGKPLGLGADYASSGKIAGRDGFERHLRTLLSNALGASTEASLGVSFGLLDGHDICRVDVPAGTAEAWVQVADKGGQKRHAFYLRSGNKAEELPSGPELSKYTKGRWKS